MNIGLISTADQRSETERTVNLLEALGIAVFPQRLRAKGSWVKGWPTMPVEQAVARTRRELRRHSINLAGRTGAGSAVIDLDAKNGCDPDETLALLLPHLRSAVIAITKTARGYHIWLVVAASVGNGFCSAIGGDVFSEAHLAMLPPSVHSEGRVYSWVQEPRQPQGRVDLTEIGIVPDEPTFEAGKTSPRTPAAQEVQDEFAALMAEKGIVQRRRAQDLVSCAWHDDRHPSLSINWETALFHCFVETCGVEGGIGALRRLLGKHTPTYRQGNAPSSIGNLGCDESDVERLTGALSTLGLGDKARMIRDCKKVYAVGRCTGCSAAPVYPVSCGHRLCLRCMPGRLAADWKDHEGSIPERLNLLRLWSRDFWGVQRDALKRTRARLGDWRQRVGLKAGLYGLRFVWGRGAAVLLAVPADHPIPVSSRAFEVEVVATDQSPDDYLRWLQEEYLAEAREWETDDDLAALLDQTRRRRRFQGFGSTYGAEGNAVLKQESDTLDQLHSQPLSKVSGGSHSGGGKKEVRLCQLCGARVEMLDFIVSKDQVELRDGIWQWVHPPGRAAAAA